VCNIRPGQRGDALAPHIRRALLRNRSTLDLSPCGKGWYVFWLPAVVATGTSRKSSASVSLPYGRISTMRCGKADVPIALNLLGAHPARLLNGQVRLPLTGGAIQTVDTTEMREGPRLTVRVVRPSTATPQLPIFRIFPASTLLTKPKRSSWPSPILGIRNPHLGESPWRSISEKLSDAKLAGELGFEPRLTESESAVLPLNYSPPNCK
jgi:hypothetical protein